LEFLTFQTSQRHLLFQMYHWFTSLNPVFQALLAGLFTWGITAAGAATVFVTRSVNRKLLDSMLGFSGGVMLAASYWSLLAPAIEISERGATPSWFPPAIGFLLGGAVLWGFDKSLPHLHLGFPIEEAEGPPTAWNRAVLLVTAITLHSCAGSSVLAKNRRITDRHQPNKTNASRRNARHICFSSLLRSGYHHCLPALCLDHNDPLAQTVTLPNSHNCGSSLHRGQPSDALLKCHLRRMHKYRTCHLRYALMPR